MTREEHEQSVANAWLGYFFLKNYIESQIETPRLREQIKCLLDEFKRLADKEQNQAEAGRKFGHLGGWKKGRPRKNGGKK